MLTTRRRIRLWAGAGGLLLCAGAAFGTALTAPSGSGAGAAAEPAAIRAAPSPHPPVPTSGPTTSTAGPPPAAASSGSQPDPPGTTPAPEPPAPTTTLAPTTTTLAPTTTTLAPATSPAEMTALAAATSPAPKKAVAPPASPAPTSGPNLPAGAGPAPGPADPVVGSAGPDIGAGTASSPEVRATDLVDPSSPSPAQLVTGAQPLPPGWTAAAHTVDVGGFQREYLTVQPATLTGPVPVYVLLSGRGQSADDILHVTGLPFATSAVMIVPEGWGEYWNVGGCCGLAWTRHVDDVGFVRTAVAQVLAATPAASASHVYVVGFSNGGRLAYNLACDLPGVFAGFSAVEAIPLVACPAMAPLDVTVVVQQGDPMLTVDSGAPPKSIAGVTEATVQAELAELQRLDGCAASPSSTTVGVATIETWSCAAGTSLRYAWYPGGDHSWKPATATTPGATDLTLGSAPVHAVHA